MSSVSSIVAGKGRRHWQVATTLYQSGLAICSRAGATVERSCSQFMTKEDGLPYYDPGDEYLPTSHGATHEGAL